MFKLWLEMFEPNLVLSINVTESDKIQNGAGVCMSNTVLSVSLDYNTQHNRDHKMTWVTTDTTISLLMLSITTTAVASIVVSRVGIVFIPRHGVMALG